MSKPFRITKRQQKTINALNDWECVVFDHEVAFLEKFAQGDAWMLTTVSWDSENMRLVYILGSGQHISDSAPMQAWLEFYNDKTLKAK
jgi:hypothetical protein